MKAKDVWREVASIIGDGGERSGLPRPVDVIPIPVSMFVGAPAAREMPRIVRKGDGGEFWHTHAIITFPEPVCGPILLGAGPYRGYGFCRAIDGDG